jgi:2-haloacid dehalogenase
MSDSTFGGIQACVFDAYGTLFDVHSAVGRYRQRVGTKADDVSRLWRTKQLEYTWLRSLMGQYVDFWQITAEGLDYALEAHDIKDPALRQDLLDAYLELDCYPEVREVLATLKARGVTTAILSNGSPRMLQAAVTSGELTELIDVVLSVDEVRIYKPHPSAYQLAVDRLQVEAREISFQSSNGWDAVGAAAFGFRVAWVNRFGQARERLPAQADAELLTLAELPSLVIQ